ncbi:MAG: hypothetical protein ACREAY_11470 [Nitrososphaera sp.]|uniref:hypothetical protein n=1 Tax=Nitrososphaera sp. TaxID=1971748 RepID=UPI003D6F6530
MLIPAAVADYVAGLTHPAALVGCRLSGMSHDCCEHDIAVFGQGENAVVHVGGHIIELVHVGMAAQDVAPLGRIEVIRDSPALALSSMLQEVAPKLKKALAAFGRKSLVSSLFCQQKMKDTRHQVASAMWLKMAAYHFVQGTLALAGTRPMPLHELAQVRQAELATDAADGVQAALECIGIERATRSEIARSIEAITELKSGDYDKELTRYKAEHLLEKSMIADCYYYLGRVASESLAGRGSAFYSKYGKLVQISMDLSSDIQQLEKLQKSLFRAAKKGL